MIVFTFDSTHAQLFILHYFGLFSRHFCIFLTLCAILYLFYFLKLPKIASKMSQINAKYNTVACKQKSGKNVVEKRRIVVKWYKLCDHSTALLNKEKIMFYQFSSWIIHKFKPLNTRCRNVFSTVVSWNSLQNQAKWTKHKLNSNPKQEKFTKRGPIKTKIGAKVIEKWAKRILKYKTRSI